MPKNQPDPEADQINLYVSKEDQSIIYDLRRLHKQFGISITQSFFKVMRACIGTMKRELPKKRTIKINGKDVTF